MTGLDSLGISVSPWLSSRTTVRLYEMWSLKVGLVSSHDFTTDRPMFAGHSRFFLGSDSAPHAPHSKSVSTPANACAAGVYTSPILLPLVAHLLESFGALDKLENFVSGFGRQFYLRPPGALSQKIKIVRVEDYVVPQQWTLHEEKVVPFWAGKSIGWRIIT
jgi:dihydroorotase